MNGRLLRSARLMATSLLLCAPLAASAAGEVDSGDTAWMLTATALVLLMTIPGLSLFYAGMVRSKNALSVMMQCFAITCLVSVLWAVYGYSLAFGNGGGLQSVVGSLEKSFLVGVDGVALAGCRIPEAVFIMFQLSFAVITPALIVGAFAERMKFSAMLWFVGLWLTLVYVPVAHWVWGGGWLGALGVLDFAGGTVVHINAGVAGLVTALVLGKRRGYPVTPMMPHNMVFTLVGAGMLWVGWFGFNAGSALAADGVAGRAVLVTQLATAVAALVWMIAEWVGHGKPSALGIASGAVAGLVAITPASGYVGAFGALMIGGGAALACFYAVTRAKPAFGYDDALDCFGVHGVGGIVGALTMGVFVAKSLGGVGFPAGVSIMAQVGKQVLGVAVTIIYDGIFTFLILKGIDSIIGLRVTDEQEMAGLDIALHDERGYNL